MSLGRRDFITLLGGAAAWPLAARAQQGERLRLIAVASQFNEHDPDAQALIAAFRRRLADLGWSEGRNVRFDIRWGATDVQRRRAIAAELVALAPDVILATAAVVVEPLQEFTRSIPIVFGGGVDPIGGGLVASLTRPGGNTTGFTSIEYTVGAKWLQLLKEIAPNVTRVAVFRDTTLPGAGQFGAIQGASSTLGVEVSPIAVRDAGETERAVKEFASRPNGGLIMTFGGISVLERDTIIAIAAGHRLPAVYPSRSYVTGGGLLSYGPVTIDQYFGAAGYVDRILKGERPSDLPVQQPTRYETALNRKTAKALGIEVPTSILLRADEVIE
jgi:putative ABC transport system substrate-binding protein